MEMRRNLDLSKNLNMINQNIKNYILAHPFYKSLYQWRKNDFIHENTIFAFIYSVWIKHDPEELNKISQFAAQSSEKLIA